MTRKYIKYNFHLMQKNKSFRFAFLLLLFISILTPLYYAFRYRGAYRYELPSADTLYIANGGGQCWSYLQLVFPFLIVLPYSFSFMRESKSGVLFYVQTRGDRKTYYYSQMIVCFLGTALVFLIPLCLNILLNSILFPVNGNDYISSYHRYDANWSNMIMGEGFYRPTLFRGIIFKGLAIYHPQLYNLLYAVWLSVSSGVMGMFAYGISIVFRRGAIALLIANYLFFQVFFVLDRLSENGVLFPVYINMNLTDYLSDGLFHHGLVYPLYVLFILCEVGICRSVVCRQLKRDEG